MEAMRRLVPRLCLIICLGMISLTAEEKLRIDGAGLQASAPMHLAGNVLRGLPAQVTDTSAAISKVLLDQLQATFIAIDTALQDAIIQFTAVFDADVLAMNAAVTARADADLALSGAVDDLDDQVAALRALVTALDAAYKAADGSLQTNLDGATDHFGDVATNIGVRDAAIEALIIQAQNKQATLQQSLDALKARVGL